MTHLSRLLFVLSTATVVVIGLVFGLQRFARAEDPTNSCCMPPYLAPSTTPGACFCDTDWVNHCEDFPDNECTQDTQQYEAAKDGYCAGTTETASCADPPAGGTTVLERRTGDWGCYGPGWISECNVSDDCSCEFVLDTWPGTDPTDVDLCAGDGCNDL